MPNRCRTGLSTPYPFHHCIQPRGRNSAPPIRTKQNIMSIPENIKELSPYWGKPKEFKAILQRAPIDTEVKAPGRFVKVPHLTISTIEAKLDLVFGEGLWYTELVYQEGIANEIIGRGFLHYLHPVLQSWQKREGFAAVQIQLSKVTAQESQNGIRRKASDIDYKILDTLKLSYPKLKADLTKNAAQTLGRFFGRDVSRKSEDLEIYSDLRDSKQIKAFREMAEDQNTLDDLNEMFLALPSAMKGLSDYEQIYQDNRGRLEALQLPEGDAEPDLFAKEKERVRPSTTTKTA